MPDKKKGAAPKKVKAVLKKIEKVDKKIAREIRTRPEMKAGGKTYKLTTPKKIGKKASAAGAGTLAWAMSLCHPDDPKYNQAKMPSPIPLKTVIANTLEPLYAGTPSEVSGNDNVVPQTPSGFGGFVMRPNTLGRQYALTTGSQILGFDPTGANNPGLISYCPADGANQALILTMMSDYEIPAPVQDPGETAWLSPLAMEEIQQLAVAYRVTSAIARAKYTGPPISGSGLIAAGAVKYDQLQNLAVETSTSTTGQAVGLEWDYFSGLESVFQGPAMEGAAVRYIPNDTRCQDWKETVLFFQNYQSDAGLGVNLTKAQVRHGIKSGKLEKIVKEQRKRLQNVKDKKIALQLTKEMKQDGSAKTRLTGLTFPNRDGSRTSVDLSTPSKVKFRDVSNVFPNISFFGASGTDRSPAYVPQPEDTPAGMARVWIEGLTAGFAINPGGPYVLDNDDIDDMLSMYSDNSWDGAEDLMVIMWNGVAPAAVLNGGGSGPPLPSLFAANLFEITKCVNYELVIDLNSLSLGQVIPTGGQTPGSAPAAIQMAQNAMPTASSLAPNAVQSASKTLDNISSTVSSVKEGASKTVETIGKAATIAMDIGEALASFF